MAVKVRETDRNAPKNGNQICKSHSGIWQFYLKFISKLNDDFYGL